jgi:hypothetical protein
MGGFNFWVDQFASFGLPLWVTEFAAPSPGSVQAEVDFMRQALWSLDNNTQIERYERACVMSAVSCAHRLPRSHDDEVWRC